MAKLIKVDFKGYYPDKITTLSSLPSGSSASPINELYEYIEQVGIQDLTTQNTLYFYISENNDEIMDVTDGKAQMAKAEAERLTKMATT